MNSSEQTGPQVLRVLLLEGLANVLILLLKAIVGFSTGSMAILADAVHSLTDVANNVIAWLVVRASQKPADREHPYGHHKFEMLAVFVLAVLLAAVAVQIAVSALWRTNSEPLPSGWGLSVMLIVLVINVVVAAWQRRRARELESQILLADASHTFADVLTTLVVIAGWQLAVNGWPWLDTACALGVAGIILYLAFGLFRNVVPVLVDAYAIEPEALSAAVRGVDGVVQVSRVRSRWIGTGCAADVVVTVSASLSTEAAHKIADAIEEKLQTEFEVSDTTVHIEPAADQAAV